MVDPRGAFALQERFSQASAVISRWPQEAFAEMPLTARTCLCVLTHDEKIDVPALAAALESDAAYIGCLGSFKTLRARKAALTAEGFDEADFQRIRGPIGLYIGGNTPAEIALGIMARSKPPATAACAPARLPAATPWRTFRMLKHWPPKQRPGNAPLRRRRRARDIMRMSAWTDDIISFMEDANRFTSYFDYLAAIVKDHTPPMGHICDAGCGMGQLALALAPFASAVDAVDTSAAATDYVGHLARREDASNVRAVRADMRLLQPEARYDTMAFCLSASVADALAIARRCCIGKVVVVDKIQAKMDACRGNGSEPSGVRARKPGAASTPPSPPRTSVPCAPLSTTSRKPCLTWRDGESAARDANSPSTTASPSAR